MDPNGIKLFEYSPFLKLELERRCSQVMEINDLKVNATPFFGGSFKPIDSRAIFKKTTYT
jgi:hypothetical protein